MSQRAQHEERTKNNKHEQTNSSESILLSLDGEMLIFFRFFVNTILIILRPDNSDSSIRDVL